MQLVQKTVWKIEISVAALSFFNDWSHSQIKIPDSRRFLESQLGVLEKLVEFILGRVEVEARVQLFHRVLQNSKILAQLFRGEYLIQFRERLFALGCFRG